MPPEIKAQMEQAQQQIQAMQEQMAQMDAALRDKQMQDQLAAQKIEIEQFQAETARLKAERELELKAMELQARLQPQQEVEPDVTESEKLNFDAALKIRLKEMEIESAENLKLMDIKAKQLEADPSVYPEIDDNDTVSNVIGALAKSLTAAKEIVRDADGRPIGVRTVIQPDAE
jgi:TolA-binding protein